MLLVRAVALAALVATTLAMPATDQTLPPDASPYAHIAEASAIFIITFATIFGIVRPTISKAFETFGVIIQPSIDKARAEIEEAEKQAKEQGLKPKPFSFIRMAVVYGISLAFVFFVIYLLRKVTGDIGNWDKVNNLFDTLLDPESLEKKEWLALAELAIISVLAALIIHFVFVPLTMRAFEELLAPYGRVAPKKSIIIIIGWTFVGAMLVAMLIPV